MSDEPTFSDSDEAPPSKLPALDFSTFVMSIIGSAFIHLGQAPHPDGVAAGSDTVVNLVLAQQDIDLLALLDEKTQGNLSGEEERLLEQGLYDLRTLFVEASRKQ